MPSESSSPDDPCGRCPHERKDHKTVCCVRCTLDDMGAAAHHECHTFVPADAETAGEPEAPVCSHDRWSEHYKKCMDCGFTPETVVSPEPEAPECGLEAGCAHDSASCGRECRGVLDAVKQAITEPKAPRRPPNAVAYVLQDGTPFEIALPGDATVRSEDGVLIVMHTQSPVKGLVQVKPWGDQ